VHALNHRAGAGADFEDAQGRGRLCRPQLVEETLPDQAIEGAVVDAPLGCQVACEAKVGRD